MSGSDIMSCVYPALTGFDINVPFKRKGTYDNSIRTIFECCTYFSLHLCHFRLIVDKVSRPGTDKHMDKHSR